MDNTLNQFVKTFLEYAQKYTTKNIPNLDPFEISDYEILKNIPSLTDQERFDIREKIFNTPGFWKNIKPFPNIFEVLKYLYNKYEIFILTTPWMSYKDCCREKLEWIEQYLPFIDLNRVIFCAHKKFITQAYNDVLIEDNPINIKEAECIVFRKHYKYNSQHDDKISFHSWEEIPDKIDEIDESLKIIFGERK